MTTLQIHLNKSGSGMASTTACGRNILRTPLSTSWEEFKSEKVRCTKCDNSKLFAFLTREDAKKESEEWEAEDSGAWMRKDDLIVAAHKAKKSTV